MNANQALWEKGDFTEIAAFMRESGEAVMKFDWDNSAMPLAVLEAEESAEPEHERGTSIAATFLRVTVSVWPSTLKVRATKNSSFLDGLCPIGDDPLRT